MRSRSLFLVAGALFLAVSACGPSGFDPESLIESVRILATRSDQPYAKPGATVHSQVLAVDGRQDAGPGAEPMRVFWLPFVCVNPPNDTFYSCFQALVSTMGSQHQAGVGPDGGGAATLSFAISAWDGGVEAGVSGGGLGGLGGLGGAVGGASLAAIPAGVDLSSFLVQGPGAVFSLPADIITSHKKVKGAFQPYGVAIVFNIACAGHVELRKADPNNPDPEQVPFGCFNAQHQPLTPNDYVIGYSEIFAYEKLTNQNPALSSFTFRDASVPLDAHSTTSASGCEATATRPSRPLPAIATPSSEPIAVSRSIAAPVAIAATRGR